MPIPPQILLFSPNFALFPLSLYASVLESHSYPAGDTNPGSHGKCYAVMTNGFSLGTEPLLSMDSVGASIIHTVGELMVAPGHACKFLYLPGTFAHTIWFDSAELIPLRKLPLCFHVIHMLYSKLAIKILHLIFPLYTNRDTVYTASFSGAVSEACEWEPYVCLVEVCAVLVISTRVINCLH